MTEIKVGHAVTSPFPRSLTMKPNPEVSTTFRKMSFFLDLRDYADGMKLANDIQSLGGTVETFLSRDVKYIVTNRSFSKKATEGQQASRQSSRSFSPASLSLSSTSSNQESTDQLRNQHPNSRAGLLVERARQSKAATIAAANCGRDLRQLTRLWGIKVIHIKALTSWIENLLSNHAKKRTEEDLDNENQCVQLSTPFLKYEDVDRRYAPQYRQFASWPAMRFDRERLPSNAVRNTATRRSPKRVPKTPVTRDIKRGFCEICSVACANVYDHVETLKHRAFVENGSNYAALDELIIKLPSPEELCQRVMASGSHHNISTDDLQASPSPHKCGRQVVDASPIAPFLSKRKLSFISDPNFARPPSGPAKIRAIMTDASDQRNAMKELNRILPPTSSPWKS